MALILQLCGLKEKPIKRQSIDILSMLKADLEIADVFDGYDMIGATTDYEHQRRGPNKETSVNVRVFIPAASLNQNQFLSNNYSKYECVKLLAMQLTIPCFSVSIVNFEHVIANWVIRKGLQKTHC